MSELRGMVYMMKRTCRERSPLGRRKDRCVEYRNYNCRISHEKDERTDTI